MCVEFQDEIFIRGEECKTREKFNFPRNSKTVILVKNLEFF